jgi:hypothetical protein
MNVRNFIIGISAGMLISSSVNALSYRNSEGYYFEVFSGATSIEDIDFGATAEIVPGLTLDASGVFGFDVGWTAGGRIGAPIFSKDVPFFENIGAPILPPAVHPTSKPNTPDASRVKPGTISAVAPKSISSIDVAPEKTSK